jgi:DNA ligase-1
MSEKLDGVRAYRDGKQFLTRQGNLYVAPDWFVEGLPDVPLDGELWLDRKAFQRAVSIARRHDRSDEWRKLRFVIFDAPALADDFEKRVAFYQDCLARHKPPFAVAHTQVVCKSLEHLRAEADRIEKLGGEGLMMRQPRSRYVAGRSSTLLKVKRFIDAEAKVIGHQAGEGRHKGRLGALLVELPNGKRFAVGTGFSDQEREAPPALGSTITFRYQELSDAGIPRFPSFLAVRHDVNLTTPSAIPASTPVPDTPPVSVSVPAAPPTAPSSTPAVSGKVRRFEYVDAKASKFWEVSVRGCDMTTSWGKIGSSGQSKTKTFKDETAAQAQAARLIEEKTGDGYVETP